MSRESAADEYDFDPAETAAADWLVRRERGLNTAEEAEFQRWLAAAPEHRRVFGELQHTWDRMPVAATVGRADGASVRRWRPWPVLLPLAAALMIAAGWWWRAAPAGNNYATVAATESGVLRTLDLPDGSVLRLNAETSVEVRFTSGRREVRLAGGELHLMVAKDPARPFVVSAGPVAVQAVGTAFDVRFRPTEAVEVLVTEGRVRVDDAVRARSLLESPSESEPVLEAGQFARIGFEAATAQPQRAEVRPVTSETIAAALAWHQREIQFTSAPLAEMVAEFNRHNEHQLVIADPALARESFGGRFLARDYRTFVRLLETNFGVRAERGDRQTILHAK